MSEPVISAKTLSKWYGEVIGLNTLELDVFPGITGIVGPNGSGKSTLFKLVSGLIRPSVGTITVLGQNPWGNTKLMSRIGLCPDFDNLSDEQTATQYLELVGGLHGMKTTKLDARIKEVAEIVGMTEHMGRKIGGFSKGMRQRMKIAGAMLHKPELLLLDEPLSGTDPLGRREIIKLVHMLHDEHGHNVVVSSHVLHEIERLTHQVAVIYKGRAVATGDIQEIRNLIDKHPHNIIVESDMIEELAKHFVEMEFVVSMQFKSDKNGVVVQVSKPDEFFNAMPDLIEELGCNVTKMYSLDDNLESVFRYLVGW
jgi:ABC-2 type transport system ATP-binding protein